jgi:hypothetical protein
MVWGILLILVVAASMLSAAALLATLRVKARYEQEMGIAEPIPAYNPTTRHHRMPVLQTRRLRPILRNCKAEADPS